MHPLPSVSAFGDRQLMRGLIDCVSRDRALTVEVLAYLGEVESRRLYLREGHPSMHAFCVAALRFSDDVAYKRIHASRAARRYPGILDAVADGRLHLTAVVLLEPHLTPDNAAELIGAATHRRKAEIEQLLAERFPRPDVATVLRAIPAPPTSVSAVARVDSRELDPDPILLSVAKQPGAVSRNVAAATGSCEAPSSAAPGSGSAMSPTPTDTRSKLTPLAPQRYALQVTIRQSTHQALRRAQELLAHQIPNRDVAEVLDRALALLVQALERRRFGAVERPRSAKARSNQSTRYIPAAVRRAVRARDGDQCTFVSHGGRRCEARERLEFDHIREFARGGATSVANLRLRCRAHNQLAAEQSFGAGFMEDKRQLRRSADR